MRNVGHRAWAVVLVAGLASGPAWGAGEAPPAEKGKWTVISDRPLADLEREGKKPDWPGNYAWDSVGNVFYFTTMGRLAWKFAR